MTNIHRERKAWSVQVIRKGQSFADYFPDGVWGGRQAALLAAHHFLDRLLMRIEPDTRVRRRIPKGTRGATRVVGVSLERHVVDGRVYERYIARWQDPDKVPRRRRFQIGRYGKKVAGTLAIEARKAGVAHTHALLLARQREEAAGRLRNAAPMPRRVKDPRSRKGISMARRRPRRRNPKS